MYGVAIRKWRMQHRCWNIVMCTSSRLNVITLSHSSDYGCSGTSTFKCNEPARRSSCLSRAQFLKFPQQFGVRSGIFLDVRRHWSQDCREECMPKTSPRKSGRDVGPGGSETWLTHSRNIGGRQTRSVFLVFNIPLWFSEFKIRAHVVSASSQRGPSWNCNWLLQELQDQDV